MLETATAIRFDRKISSGRNKPSLVACIRRSGLEVELIAKFSGGCERGCNALIAESIAALLGIDLGLPIPEPFIVEFDQDFIDIVEDVEIQKQLQRSVGFGFGSMRLPAGYSLFTAAEDLPDNEFHTATNVIAFDGTIQNPDRRPDNSNCLTNGTRLAIFDHELAFMTEGIIGWRPPWETGGCDNLVNNRHIFFNKLSGKGVDLEGFRQSWDQITDERLDEYMASLPPEWIDEGDTSTEVLSYIRGVRDHIDDVIIEIERLLS